MKPCCCRVALAGIVSLAPALAAAAQEPRRHLSDLDCYPYAAGTQIFRPLYQFTQEPALVEAARAMLEMGSNVIKFGMGRSLWGNVARLDPGIQSLTDLAEREPAHKRVLDMPFAYYVIWAYPFSVPDANLSGPISRDAQDREYKEIYEFTRYLLTAYNGTGKTFYLGHWEGDWILLGNFKAERDPEPDRVERMISWLNNRQKAVDDARRDTPHQAVQVHHYTEVNLVQKAIGGRVCLTSSVLPETHVDYVSYSSYDSLDQDAGKKLRAALDYIESRLPPRPDIRGKRVFIGEYGFPALNHPPAEQARRSREVIRTAIEWGCPLVLYWELYNNEKEGDKQRGFWLIDDKGAKQPVYDLHRIFLKNARRAVAEFKARQQRLPDPSEYAKLMAGEFESQN